jgi:hypothetical protein
VGGATVDGMALHEWSVRTVSVVSVAVIFGLAATGAALGAPASPVSSVCGASPAAGPVPAAGKAGPVRVSTTSAGTPTIDIGRTNRAGDVEIVFQSVAPLPDGPLLFDVSRFRSGSQRLDPRAVAVTVDRRNDKEVRVDVCVDRNVTKVSSGAYTGSVIIRDARLSGPDVPVTLNIQDHRLGWVGGLGILLTSMLAVVGIWVTVRRAAGDPTFGRDALAALRAWSKVNLIFTAIVAIGAAWTVLQTQGLADAAFAGDLESYVHLFLIMFGAAYTAGSIPPVIAGQGTRGEPLRPGHAR